MTPTIGIKRIYDMALPEDGVRILVDRLWPRGIKKENAQINYWLKDVAPSTELRKWFHSDNGNWPVFKLRYLQELKQNDAVNELLTIIKSQQATTLIYAARNERHNHALVLREYAESILP